MAATRMMSRRSGGGHPGGSSSILSISSFSSTSTAAVQSQPQQQVPLHGDVDVDGDQVMITPIISVTTTTSRAIVNVNNGNVKPKSRKRKSTGAATTTAARGAEDAPDGKTMTATESVDGVCGDDEVAAPKTKMTKFVAPSQPCNSNCNSRKRKSTSTASPSTDSGFNDSLNEENDDGKALAATVSASSDDHQVPTTAETITPSTSTSNAIVPKLLLPMTPSSSPALPVGTFGDAEEMWEYMIALDEKYLRKADLLKLHPSLSPQMRSILFDWMMDVCEAYNLHRETLYLSFDYLDRYLAANTGVLKHHLQLIGITALFIAAKVEEIYPPKLSTFAYVTDGACTVTDIVQMENIIMKDLKWKLHPITPSSWTNFFLQIESIATNAISPNRYTEIILRTMRSGRGESNNRRLLTTEYEKVDFVRCMRLLDLSIIDIQSLKFSYSTLAAASMYHVKGRKACLTASGMSWEDLAPCVFWMAPFAQVLAKSDVPDVLPGIPGVADENRHLIQSQCVLLSMLEEVHLKEAKAKLSSPIAKITEGLLTPPRSHEKNPNNSTTINVRSPRRKTRKC